MAGRVSVGMTFRDSFFFWGMAGAAVLGGAVGFFLLANKGVVSNWLFGAAILAGLAALVRGSMIVVGRRWLTPTGDGFIYRTWNGESDFVDEQVTDFAISAKSQYSNGSLEGIVRQGVLTVNDNGPTRELPIRYRYRVSQQDPLGPFIERILLGLTERSARGLRHQPLSGDGWQFDTTALTLADKTGTRYILTDEIAAVDIVEESVSLWVRGDETPTVRIPVGSRNALILARLVDRECRSRPVQEMESADGLGRVIFERSISYWSTNTLGLFAILGLLVVGGAGLLGGKEGAAIVAGLWAVITAPILLYAWMSRSNVLRCHTSGVSVKTRRGTTELKYEDVDSFTYQATRHFVNGVYTGTNLKMQFKPRKTGRMIAYKATITNADAELENLREHISQVIASHQLRRLKSGRPVYWNEQARFFPEGLEITKAGGLLSRPRTVVLPYEDVAGLDIQDGHFYLFQAGVKKPVLDFPVSLDNFFPGHVLLEQILGVAATR